MNMQQLFSTPEREDILVYLLDHPDEKLNINALSHKMGLSPGTVHKYATILRRYGILMGDELIDSHLTRALRLLKNLVLVERKHLVRRLRKDIHGANGIGIYGSWSNGTNRPASDLDVWVKTDEDVDDLCVARASKELSKLMGASVEILVLTPGRLEHLRQTSESLYHTLFNSITLWGEGP